MSGPSGSAPDPATLWQRQAGLRVPQLLVPQLPVPQPPVPHFEGRLRMVAVLITANALLRWRADLLKAFGGAAADLDWLLDLEAGLAWPELQALRLHPEREVSLRCDLTHLQSLWQRHRQQAEPLQYLIGRCPFRQFELAVGPGVLIPRQETELLVDLAVSLLPPSAPPALWADLGTGSGCLAVALASAWPQARGLAVDRSPEALAQAEANLRRAGVEAAVSLRRGSWWQPLQPWWGRLDLVVSNPPYIPSAVVDGLDPVVRLHEPRLALDGGVDGLDCLRTLLAGAASALAPGGWLLVEHHHDQSEAVLALFAAAGLQEVCAHRDLEGRCRFVVGQRSPAHRVMPTPP